MLSTQEVKSQGNKLVAEIDGEEVAIPGAEDDSALLDSDDPVAIRVWESHPRRHLEADSAVRSSLGLLEELKLLNAAVAAIARSRLTGRGIVLVPQGTKFPTSLGQEKGKPVIPVARRPGSAPSLAYIGGAALAVCSSASLARRPIGSEAARWPVRSRARCCG
ncbi:hypothetical protein AB0E25_39195 [Streptomyces bobili]|uniref:hypothetical protein n=1 Tax=Streptomyces bobili TaxID=67280 RepID=UPI0033DC4DAA